MPSTQNETKNDKDPHLETITRVILVFGIIFLTGGIIYIKTRPPEDDILFFLLNDEMVMRDYPTNTSVGGSVIFHTFVENQLGSTEEFAVRIYHAEADYWISANSSADGDEKVFYIENQTKTVTQGEQWISNPFNVSFLEAGKNQLIIIELWKNTLQGWQYIEDFLLTLRISVYEEI